MSENVSREELEEKRRAEAHASLMALIVRAKLVLEMFAIAYIVIPAILAVLFFILWVKFAMN